MMNTLHGMLERWNEPSTFMVYESSCTADLQPIADQLQAVANDSPHTYSDEGIHKCCSAKSQLHKPEICTHCRAQRILGTAGGPDGRSQS